MDNLSLPISANILQNKNNSYIENVTKIYNEESNISKIKNLKPFPKNNNYSPKDEFTKKIYENLDLSIKYSNSDYLKLYDILSRSFEYHDKHPNIIKKKVNEQIYNNLINSPFYKDTLNIYNKNNIKLSFNTLNPILENYLKYNKYICLTSPFYKHNTTVFELNDYFIQYVDKKAGLKSWTYDEPGIKFLWKDKDMTMEKYSKLNAEGKSFYAIINNQFVCSTDKSYSLDTVLGDIKNGKVLFETGVNTDPYSKSKISDNEMYQAVMLINKLKNNNFDFNKYNYFGISNEPYQEYVLSKNKEYINFINILHNGEGKDVDTNKPIYSHELEKNGYTLLNSFDYFKERDGCLNSHAGKWKEISEYKYNSVLNSSKHYKYQNEGFFNAYPYYGDLREYYQKHNERYFTSLQRLSYDRDYITKTLESSISRMIPLKAKIAELSTYLYEHNKIYYNSFIEKGKIENLTSLHYDMLKSAGFDVTKINKYCKMDVDGTEKEHNTYSYDIRNQKSEASSHLKYDRFIINYLDEYLNKKNVSSQDIDTLLKKMSFSGDTKSLSEYLITNNKYSNYETLNNLFNKNSCKYAVVTPTLNNISTFAVSNNINMDKYTKQKTIENKQVIYTKNNERYDEGR